MTAQFSISHTDGAPPDGLVNGFALQAHSAASTNESSSYNALAKELELRAALQRVDALCAHEAALERRIQKLERALSKARESALYDELTGLPNRRLLLSRFKRAVARGMRRGHSVAMLLLDLDGFKLINDVFGHAAGDIVLRQVAIRLNACLRASDTACRYGGDEFMTLLPDLEDEGNAIGAASKIRAHLAPPYRFRGMALNVTVSIGMAMYPIDGKEYGELARHADQAMYREKAASVVRRASLYPTPQRLEPRV